MKLIRLLIAVSLLLYPALSSAAGEGYGYPIQGPYAATILQTPAAFKPKLPDKVPMKELVLEVLPGLERPELFFYDEGVRCSFAPQPQKAPLVFLIPGAGGSSKAPRMITLLKALYQGGFHVIILPSPTHPNFIISASQSHVPGDLTEDAADLYRTMETAWREVKDDIEVSDFYLAGFSLGGTEAAFVAKLDEQRRSFNFRKVLMINPAVNLYSSIGEIEGLLDKIPGGKGQIIRFFNGTLDKFTQFYHRGQFVAFNDDFLYKVYQEKLLTPEEAAGLIGVVYRLGSANMIFTSDVMTKGGYVVPKDRELSNTDSLTDYFRVSVHLSFFQYIDEYFYPHYLKQHPGVSREQLRESEGFKSIEGYLQASGKFGVMVNENDFILAPGDLEYLRRLFGERAKVYPSGGHGGNFEYQDNLAYAVGFFK